ncbi:MAG TPA: MarR family transcriptional regulator, partial [Kiloniellales bacterium]
APPGASGTTPPIRRATTGGCWRSARGAMTADPTKAEAVTREVRACFNRLKALGDALHRDIGVTAAMRAVLETLYEAGEQTVPQIARSKSVSRQHIQVLVNSLIGAELVAVEPNPADRRSPLVAFTKEGRMTFKCMRQREKAAIADLARTLAPYDLDATLATLAGLHAWLDQNLAKGDIDA